MDTRRYLINEYPSLAQISAPNTDKTDTTTTHTFPYIPEQMLTLAVMKRHFLINTAIKYSMHRCCLAR